jgi:hypothetical protein
MLLLASTSLAASNADQWELKEERWYQMLLGSQVCGFNAERVETRAGLVRTTTENELRLGRMGQEVVVRTRSAFTETTDGKPVEWVQEKRTGAAPVTSKVLFNADSMDVIDEQGGRTTARRQPLPSGQWLTPNQARDFMRRRIAGGADQLEYSTLDPESGLTIVRIQSQRTGAGQAQVDGRTLQVSTWKTLNSVVDKPSIEEISADGVLVSSSTDLGVGVLQARLSTRDIALGNKGSAEVMARSFVELKQRGERLQSATRAQLRVRAGGGKLADLPSAGAQQVTRVNAGEATIDINLDRSIAAERGDDADPKYRRASVMADSEEPRIKALADSALKGVPNDSHARADALRAAVSRHLTRKNLASGFATATEAVKSQAGDCTEHAVLLAACLRHAGIPSRVASGLLYVQSMGNVRNVMGWHMWTQALIEGAWIDVDAVLPPSGARSHAGHLMVVASAADGASMDSDFARIVEFIGDLQIDIVSIEGAPATAASPQTARPVETEVAQ